MFKRKKRWNNDTQVHGARLITAVEPKHVISERFRTVRTNISFTSAPLERFQVVMFTSAEMSDGKTTVASNLAVSWAETGKQVLYVDADLRRPTGHSTFAVLNVRGLSTILATEAQPKDIVQPTVIDHLEVLTSGPMPPNPAELLSGSRMGAFVKWARHNYDIVMIDVPPMIAVTDAQVILPLVDGVVLVTSLGKTLKANMKRTVEMLRLGETNILGVVSQQRGFRSKKDIGYDYGYGE